MKKSLVPDNLNAIWKIGPSVSDFDQILPVLLRSRSLGVNSLEDLNSPIKLNAYLVDFPRDFLQSLKDASSLILQAMQDQRPIIILGDYDADGVCATSVLALALKRDLNYSHVFEFIPNRFTHGYGMSQESIKDALALLPDSLAEKFVLFVTVDSGITSVEEAGFLKSLGHNLIITDHHQKLDVLPDADVVVWSDKIVGAAIAWLLTKVLGAKTRSSIVFPAIATVTDVYPLADINRALVKAGLDVLNTEPPVGWKELLQVSNLTPGSIEAYSFGWVLGPRINAAGRLENASTAVRLFLSSNSAERVSLAQRLDTLNKTRQDETLRMFELLHTGVDSSRRFILEAREDFHEGLIGLVAGRLVRSFHKPSIVVSLNGTFGKGSVRSIQGINIIEILRRHSDLFEALGGHPMAAGFTIRKEKLLELENRLQQEFGSLPLELFNPVVVADLEMPLSLVGMPLLDLLKSLKPFGTGNPEPRFFAKDVTLVNKQTVGRTQDHVSLSLMSPNLAKPIRGIAFKMAPLFEPFGLGDKVDLIFTVRPNEYRGRVSPNLVVEAVRPAQD